MTVDGTTLTNGLVTVDVDPADGTFSLDGLAGLGQLVDGGDVGDTYNWSPPDHDVFVDHAESVSVSVAEAGPVRGRARGRRRLPASPPHRGPAPGWARSTW